MDETITGSPAEPEQEPALTPVPTQAQLVATLAALAGVRRGDRVAAVGVGRRTASALLAMAHADDLVSGDADVAVAGAAEHVPDAAGRLAPGGRLVAVARDDAHAALLATQGGVLLRHVEPLGAGVAWSGTSRLDGS